MRLDAARGTRAANRRVSHGRLEAANSAWQTYTVRGVCRSYGFVFAGGARAEIATLPIVLRAGRDHFPLAAGVARRMCRTLAIIAHTRGLCLPLS